MVVGVQMEDEELVLDEQILEFDVLVGEILVISDVQAAM